MVNLMLSFFIALAAAVMPWTAFSADIEFIKADELIKKYNTKYERPKSCPMESRKFSDLIAKTEEIKDVLKGNCLQKESDKMTEVLESIKGIQDELKNKSMVTDSGTAIAEAFTSVAGVADGSTTSINGLKFSQLFSNITTMFKKNQCNMEDGRVLEMTADLIYDSTQLGVLAGSKTGLIVAGTGFLISSALRLIDLIFKQRFNFDKPADRQSFVKINCAFYEIRRELDAQGALDIENNSSRDDFRDVKAINEEIVAELKTIENEKVNISKSHAAIDSETFKSNVGDLSEFKKILNKVQKYLQPGVNAALDIPTETQKLLMISQLAQDYDKFVSQIKIYKELKISSIPMLDDLFINDMKKFDSLDIVAFAEAMNISAKDFNENHRARILFHIIRISSDITTKEGTLTDKSQKIKTAHDSKLDSKKELLLSKLAELKKVEIRLGNLVAPKEYSGLDDGSENMVTILDNHNKISSQLYGEWGEKFLKFATYKSSEEVKNFNERLDLFNKKYSGVINGKNVDNLSSTYLCQDAQKLRLIFKRADSIVQEGFDFIVTNKDIIYSDVKNYYNGTINEENNTGAMGPVEKVQRHYRSAILALRYLKGESIITADRDRYLGNPWLGSIYIGKSMIDVSATKVIAKNIQDIYERLSCHKSLVSELD